MQFGIEFKLLVPHPWIKLTHTQHGRYEKIDCYPGQRVVMINYVMYELGNYFEFIWQHRGMTTWQIQKNLIAIRNILYIKRLQ